MSAETPEETVEVVIQATANVEYCQTVRVPRAHFEKLDKMLNGTDWKERDTAAYQIRDLLDTRNFLGAVDFEIEGFRRKPPAA